MNLTKKSVDTLTEEEIRKKLCKHYAGREDGRQLIKRPMSNGYDEVGAVFYLLGGSPPKAYAIFTPRTGKLSLYDGGGKRFRIMNGVWIENCKEVERLE